MDPLSALPLSASPDPRVIRLAVPDTPASIPAAELQKLSPSSLPDGVPGAVPDSSFESVLGQMVAEVSGRQAVANEAVAGLVSGQHVSLHQAVIAMEEASISFQLMVEVRNKLLESYQELMRMQI